MCYTKENVDYTITSTYRRWFKMLIQCTKKVLDELKIKPSIVEEEDPLFSFHANVITINRRKVLVLMNDKNRYVIVLYGMKAKDWKRIDKLIIEAVRESFKSEFIKEEVIEQYIQAASTISFTKTKNRSFVAQLNKACDHVYFYERDLEPDKLIQTEMGKNASRLLVGVGNNQHIHPNEELYKDLAVYSGQEIFQCKAVKLKVTLLLENRSIWRRIIVPLDITFKQFHKVLQICFGWQNYHLHEFYIYEEAKDELGIHMNHSAFHPQGYQPIVNLVSYEESLSYACEDIPCKMENGIKLAEYLPANMKYIYDFGDNWEHIVECEEIIADFNMNHPICLDGAGAAPPEDVGGEYGFDEFLATIADSNHPDYQFMSSWGRQQGYQEFDKEQINRLLK